MDCIYGASLLALRNVGARYGYTLVNVIKCLDTIFVRSSIVGSCKVSPFQRWKSYTGIQYLKPFTDKSRLYTDLIEYETWNRTHDVKASTAAAVAQLNVAALKGDKFCSESSYDGNLMVEHTGGH